MLDPAARPPAPDARAGAAVGEYVLIDGTTSRVRIEPRGRAMVLTFVDAAELPLPGSPVELPQDLEEAAGPFTVTGHCVPARSVCIAEDELHDGLLRVFLVHGTRTARFFQYARNEVSLDLRSAGRGVVGEGTRWRLDSGSPYRGSFTNEDLVATGMLDGPGTGQGFDPFEAVLRMAAKTDGDAAPTLPADAIFTLAHELETLPYADGTLLGSVTWGYTLTWTLSEGRSSGPEPEVMTPRWRPATDTPLQRESALGSFWTMRRPPAPRH